jgi:outer membrane protein assembly factor BamB
MAVLHKRLGLIAVVVAWCGSADAQTVTAPARPVKQTRSADDKTPLQLFPLATVWTLPLNNALTAAPAFDETRAFFPLEENQLAAYDLIGRTQLWIAPIGTTVEPVVGDGIVYIFEAAAITALHAESGKPAWRVPFSEMLAVPPTLADDLLITVTVSGDIAARRTRDGAVVWHQPLGAAANASPAVAGHRVFVPTTDSLVHSLDRETGTPQWKRTLGGPGNDVLAIGERLYLGSRDRYFYCLNASTGEVEWRWPTGANVIGKPVVDEQSVYFVSLDNVLRALNRSSGVQRWKSPLPLRPTTGPIKWSLTIIVAGAMPGLKGYNVKDGKLVGQSTTSNELSAPPHLVDDSSLPFPILLAVTSDITGLATVTAYSRTVEPEIVALAPLPNAVTPPSFDPPKDLGAVSPLPGLSPVNPATGP